MPSRLAGVLLSPDLSSLLHAAKMMILKLSGQGLSSSNDATPDSSAGPPALKRFKFLATRLETTTMSSSTLSTSQKQDIVLNQLNRYIADTSDRFTCNSATEALMFWHNIKSTYSKLAYQTLLRICLLHLPRRHMWRGSFLSVECNNGKA
jgi:hypothetical protein